VQERDSVRQPNGAQIVEPIRAKGYTAYQTRPLWDAFKNKELGTVLQIFFLYTTILILHVLWIEHGTAGSTALFRGLPAAAAQLFSLLAKVMQKILCRIRCSRIVSYTTISSLAPPWQLAPS
jgi:hypothetical protein